MPPPDHSVRLRDGDREVQISGNPAFVRQVLDDLPVLMARLRGEAPGRTAISMPAPPPAAEEAESAPAEAVAADPNALPNANGSSPAAPAADSSLEDRIIEVLRGSSRPLPIAAIRQRLDDDVSGQQVRRLLERAADQVAVSTDKPAAYSLR